MGGFVQEIFRENKSKIEFLNNNSMNFPPHIHESIELVLVTSGTGKAFCNGKCYEINKGSIVLILPNQVHYYTEFSHNTKATLLIIKPDLLPEHSDTFLNKSLVSPHYRLTENDGNLITLLNVAFDEFEKSANTPVVSSILSAFFSVLFQKVSLEQIDDTNDCASKILKYCKQHYKENISLEDISKALFISKCYISHVLNDKIKISFNDYINSLRITYAIKLLEDKRHSITDIAFLSGFSTTRSFNRAFQQHMGVSPLKYKSNIKQTT